MKKLVKRLAPKPQYVSPKQLTIEGFETPFEQNLLKNNRWVILGNLIPWDEICAVYDRNFSPNQTGRKPLNGRIVIGSIIIKHLCGLDDRETIDQISENVYMQYFLGYSSFSTTPPFDPSLFVEIRKRLGMEWVNEINEKIIALKVHIEESAKEKQENRDNESDNTNGDHCDSIEEPIDQHKENNKGKVIFDATACPQNIAFPTDLDLLSGAREKSEELIDKVYNKVLHKKKPRTYRKVARKNYLRIAQMKNKPKKVLQKGLKKQLSYLGRNISNIHKLLDSCPHITFNKKELKYFHVLQTVYQQQLEMYQKGVHSVDDRIVSIHQPHVRPIVRGKAHTRVEFGAKIHLSLIDGISFLDEISWDAYNEGAHMMQYVELFYKRFRCYPKEILADKIYCTRENRRLLKEKGIRLKAKPLGRPAAVADHVSPGERNPVEGKFGQAKTAYGLDNIRARLKNTSQSWIASIILVLNLVKLAGLASYCLIIRFSAFLSLKFTEFIKSEFLSPLHAKIYYVCV